MRASTRTLFLVGGVSLHFVGDSLFIIFRQCADPLRSAVNSSRTSNDVWVDGKSLMVNRQCLYPTLNG